jgi:hypothetical protein
MHNMRDITDKIENRNDIVGFYEELMARVDDYMIHYTEYLIKCDYDKYASKKPTKELLRLADEYAIEKLKHIYT